MAYIQKVTPPPNKILSFSLKDFSGGLNNRSDQIEDNQASDIRNMDFADDTLLEKRKGQEYFRNYDVGDPITFLDEFKPYEDENVLIISTDGKLYIEDEVLTDLKSSANGTTHQGKYFFADGEKLYVYGRFAQESETYTKVHGNPIDDYVLLEIVSPKDDHDKLSKDKHIRGVLNIDYDKFEIYYEPCEFEFEDNYMGANKVPEGVKYLVSHLGRLYISGAEKDDDNVFISAIDNPFYFPVSLPIQIPPNSDEIVGMAVFDNSIVIGRKYDIHVIDGNTNRPNMGAPTFQVRKLNSHTGFANNNCIDIAHNYLFFLGYDGNFYALGNTRIDEKILSTQIISKTIDIEKPPINASRDDLKNSSSVFCKDKWYVNLGDKMLVYSYRHMSWVMFTGINGQSMYNLDERVIWGNKEGRIVTFAENNYLDFGMPYEAYWYSKFFDMDEANAFKQFRECFLVAHTYNDHNSTINMTFEIDYADVKDRAVITNQLAIWGKSKWGDRWINRHINESIPIVIGKRGRNIRFKISNGYYLDGEADTYDDLEYYQGRKEGVLVRVKDTGKFYLYTDWEWVELDIEEDLNQRMKFYQVNGDYEFRGKR